MNIRIITSCTGEKLHKPDNQLTKEAFAHLHDTVRLAELETELVEYRTSAENIYTGQQHVRLMKGVRESSASIDLWILSAGYGLIPAGREIVPYECTFATMKAGEIRDWSRHLNIPDDARTLFAQSADLNIVLLGDHYLRALELDDTVQFAAPTLFFTGRGAMKRVKGQGQIRVVSLSNPEAKRFSYGLVGLKGELATRLLIHLKGKDSAEIATLFDNEVDILNLLEPYGQPNAPSSRKKAKSTKKTKKTSKPKIKTIINPAVNKIIQIPASFWQKRHQSRFRYFIPDWDDQVDPNFDFETETHSGGRGNWGNQVYAHQMYPSPNYDGILISKVVAEQSKAKRARIESLGVHKHLRVPDNFPVMGDCGAFGYIKEETPPYSTTEILDYYTRLDFDYGVSIDHLIVASTGEQRDFRYELTIHNAEEFLREHQQMGLPWTPIGAVQGWDPDSYAYAVRQYVAMGYKYIALGGLVRTKTTEVLRILDAVQPCVPDDVDIHLFGLGRLDGLPDFVGRGVTSIDSASHLRRAWLGARDNFWTLSGEVYAAIRIPQVGTSRAKRIVAEGRATEEHVQTLADAAMQAMRHYDAGLSTLEATLDALEAYDQLIADNRATMRAIYQRTLEATPWKHCPCAICQRWGVEVAIFRGNNRNRRRGFHNTYVFYELAQRILAGETVNVKGKLVRPSVYQQSLFGSLEG